MSKPIRVPFERLDNAFIPRPTPRPAPVGVGIFDAPYICVPMNVLWVPHILGVLEVLARADAWSGTETDVYNAQQEIEKLMSAMVIAVAGCGDAGMQLRIDPDNPCNIQILQGDTWQAWYTGCAGDKINAVVTNTLPAGSNATAAYEPLTGTLTLGIPRGDTGATGAQGPVGATGAQGIQGLQGEPGICQDCGEIQDTPGEPSNVKSCNVSAYLSDVLLPTAFSDLVLLRQNTADITSFVSGALGIAAVGLTIVTGTSPFLLFGLGIASGSSALGSTWNSADANQLSAAATPQFWQDVKCALLAVMPQDGILPDGDTLANALNVLPASAAKQPLIEMVKALSPQQRSLAAYFGATYNGDCSLCETNDESGNCTPDPGLDWCYNWDFLASNQPGWTRTLGPAWQSGVGWTAASNNAISLNNVFAGSGAGIREAKVYLTTAPSNVSTTLENGLRVFTGAYANGYGSGLNFAFNSMGTGALVRIKIQGVGTMPAWGT